jgi:tetratricopeptide (TPR) repeat protein
LNLAQSYEQAGQLDQAISQYNILKKNTGFTNMAYLGLARMYMAKEDPVQARMAYQELLSNLEDTSDPVFKSQVEAQLAALDAVNPAILLTPEENKE